jgi:hypothetical protein
LSQLLHKIDPFTKTGSGQTQENTQKRLFLYMQALASIGDIGVLLHGEALDQRSVFECFSCVCPEPVLLKYRIYI